VEVISATVCVCVCVCMYVCMIITGSKKKVKVFRYKPEVALGVPGG
jgi:hypothetical protein